MLTPPNAGTDPLRPVPTSAALRAALGTQDRTGGLGFLLDDAVVENPTRAARAEHGPGAR